MTMIEDEHGTQRLDLLDAFKRQLPDADPEETRAEPGGSVLMSTELHTDKPAVEESERDQFHRDMLEAFKRQLPDPDPGETAEWIAALDDVYRTAGRERADFLLRKVLKRARQLRIGLPGLVQSRYINTISPEQEPAFPGDEQMELRVRRIIRWNAALMVLRANHDSPGIGGRTRSRTIRTARFRVWPRARLSCR